jgi:hypothetical protein
MSMALGALLLLLLAAPAKGGDARDTLVLQGGREIEGRILLETEEKVLFQSGSRKKWYPRSAIKGTRSVAASHRELLERFGTLAPESPEALLDLASWCRDQQLPHEEKLLLWRILVSSPEHEEANLRLGHRKVGEAFKAPLKGNWVSVTSLDAAHSEWSRAWELRSEHFTVRCSAGLQRTLDTLFELEFLYDAFYSLHQEELLLLHLTDPVNVQMYPDRTSFPSMGSNVGAFFSKDENTLYTYLEESGRPRALFHEGTHALLHNVSERTTGTKGKFPSWLDEAWAVHMETIVVPERSGKPRLDPDRLSLPLLEAVATETDPYSITRILNLETADFGASSKQQLKYGQAYALFHYMLIGEPRLRERFVTYIRSALEGKGQSSTFTRLFKPELDFIEAAHVKYARDAVGR